MDHPTPQAAFHDWLHEALAAAMRSFRAPDRARGFLDRAVDHADLERRLRAIERGAATPLFW